MSREIKFRGQKLNSNEWVYGSLAYFFNNKKNTCIMPNCYFGTRDFGEQDEQGKPIIEDEMALGGFINVKPETVGQFTGLYDKNGKEIYEGDVIKYTQHHFNTDMTKEKVKVVKWKYDKWGVYETNAGESDIEIIGNIYQNPELITQRS